MPEKVTALAQALLDCVVQRLIDDGSPVCEACVVASAEVPPANGCDCKCTEGQGRAWIRVVEIRHEFNSIGRSSGREVQRCPAGAWNVTFQVGVWRCTKDKGKGACADLAADSQQMHKDLVSLVSGVECCPVMKGKTWAQQQAEPVGPSGGCVAATYTFVVQMQRLTGPA